MRYIFLHFLLFIFKSFNSFLEKVFGFLFEFFAKVKIIFINKFVEFVLYYSTKLRVFLLKNMLLIF